MKLYIRVENHPSALGLTVSDATTERGKERTRLWEKYGSGVLCVEIPDNSLELAFPEVPTVSGTIEQDRETETNKDN